MKKRIISLILALVMLLMLLPAGVLADDGVAAETTSGKTITQIDVLGAPWAYPGQSCQISLSTISSNIGVPDFILIEEVVDGVRKNVDESATFKNGSFYWFTLYFNAGTVAKYGTWTGLSRSAYVNGLQAIGAYTAKNELGVSEYIAVSYPVLAGGHPSACSKMIQVREAPTLTSTELNGISLKTTYYYAYDANTDPWFPVMYWRNNNLYFGYALLNNYDSYYVEPTDVTELYFSMGGPDGYRCPEVYRMYARNSVAGKLPVAQEIDESFNPIKTSWFRGWQDAYGKKVTKTTTLSGSSIGMIPIFTSCPFNDVPEKEYYYATVKWGYENNIIYGSSATSFAPNGTCTRAQFITFLWRAAGNPEPFDETNNFSDVSSKDYYYKAVLWGAQNKIIFGTSKTTFSPDDNVSRAQAATFLYRYGNTHDFVDPSGMTFKDVPSTAYYYYPVLWGKAHKLIYGTSTTTFDPDGNCTRAQAATFIYRLMKYLGKY